METESFGKLLNNAGKNNYTDPDSLKNVIKYITGTNGKSKKDVVAWGGLGILEYKDIDSIIRLFAHVQQLHTRRGNFGRYIDHEYFSFSHEGASLVIANNLDIDRLARKMAYDFYNTDRCQVVYGVHSPTEEGKHLHIHFAINTVSYVTGNKRRENKTQTNEREERFQKIIADEISGNSI